MEHTRQPKASYQQIKNKLDQICLSQKHVFSEDVDAYEASHSWMARTAYCEYFNISLPAMGIGSDLIENWIIKINKDHIVSTIDHEEPKYDEANVLYYEYPEEEIKIDLSWTGWSNKEINQLFSDRVFDTDAGHFLKIDGIFKVWRVKTNPKQT